MTIHTPAALVTGDRRSDRDAVSMNLARQPYHQVLSGCDAEALGRDDLASVCTPDLDSKLGEAVQTMRRDYQSGGQPFMQIANARDDLPAMQDALARLSANAKTIVFFGTGGSSLGGQVLAQIAGWNIPGDRGERRGSGSAGSEAPRRPRTRFYDNLDGRTLARTLASLDLATTRFVITSKSGNTAETLIQMVAALQAVSDAQLSSRIPELFLGVSEPAEGAAEHNAVRRLCLRYGIPCLDHPTDIGGRYSALTVTGMLPALARGLDPVEIRAGAQAVVDALTSDAVADNVCNWAPAAGARAVGGLLLNGGVSTFALMPYGDRLGRLAPWYAQLFGESLGKNGRGATPVAALGPVDQHSQLQLWMDGPRAHMISFVRERTHEAGPVLDTELAEVAGLGYLAGKPAAALVDSQAEAVPEALRQAGRPHRIFDIENLDGFVAGGLLMHFMAETVLLGTLLAVDPFDQPAVETGKKLARDLLSGG
ncbi:MAG: glucose-6-phosphate isomerase [Pseudomonadota bacterium]